MLREPEVASVAFFIILLIADALFFFYNYERFEPYILLPIVIATLPFGLIFTRRIAAGAKFNYKIQDGEFLVYNSNNEYVSIGKLENKVVIITGGNAGIGYATALALAKWGCRVVLASRDVNRGLEAQKKITALTGNQKVEVRALDLASFESIRNFVKKWNIQGSNGVDILINNAGVSFPKYQQTEEGFEIHFGTNHIGPFMLTKLLLPNIIQKKGRVVTVASAAHKFVPNKLDWKAINEEKNFSPFTNYGYSKLANIYFARRLAEDHKGDGIVSVSLHPGAVRTELARRAPWFILIAFNILSRIFFKNQEEGSQTSLFCALSPDVVNGAYYSDCKKGDLSTIGKSQVETNNLWKITEEMVSNL